MYQIIVRSGSVRHILCENIGYDEAIRLCEENHWVYDWNGGLWWDMEIEEVLPQRVMYRSKWYLQKRGQLVEAIRLHRAQLEDPAWNKDPETVEVLQEMIAEHEKALAELIAEFKGK